MATAATVSIRGDRLRGLERAATQLLLGCLPLGLTLWLAVSAIRFHWVAEDFSLAYYPAAHRVLAGADPYAATHAQLIGGAAFVYPAVAAVLLAPLALVSSGLADHLYTLVCLALVPATLWTAGVRDWRIYGAAMLWYPMIIGWQGENVSVPLMFMVALAWRHRERPIVAAAVVALAISIKPVVWPLALWVLATRRYRAAGLAVAWGIALNLVAWSVVGLGDLPAYLRLSAADATAMWRGGYGVPAALHHLGLGRGPGEVALVIAAAALAGATLQQGLIRRREREALVIAVVLMLVASPLVWIHYFVLLAVPLAISRPRFTLLWVVPLAMWLLPPGTAVDGWQIALAWTLVGCCAVPLLNHRRRRPGMHNGLPEGDGAGVRLGYGLSSSGSLSEEPVSASLGTGQVPSFGLMGDY